MYKHVLEKAVAHKSKLLCWGLHNKQTFNAVAARMVRSYRTLHFVLFPAWDLEFRLADVSYIYNNSIPAIFSLIEVITYRAINMLQ